MNIYEDLWLERAREFQKSKSNKTVWNGSIGEFIECTKLTTEEIARLLREESLWESYNDD